MCLFCNYEHRALENTLKNVENVVIGLLSSTHIVFSAATRQCVFDTIIRVHRTMALGHHHDTITGTSRDNIVRQYLSTLDQAQEQMDHIVGLLLRRDLPAPVLEDMCKTLASSTPSWPEEAQVASGADFYDRSISLSLSRQYFALLDLSLPRAVADTHVASLTDGRDLVASPRRYFHLNTNSEQGEMCFSRRVSSQQYLSVTYMPAIEFVDEKNCTERDKCDRMSAGKKSLSQRHSKYVDGSGLGNSQRIIIGASTSGAERGTVPILTVIPCDDVSARRKDAGAEAVLHSPRIKATEIFTKKKISATASRIELNRDDVRLLYDIAGAMVRCILVLPIYCFHGSLVDTLLHCPTGMYLTHGMMSLMSSSQ